MADDRPDILVFPPLAFLVAVLASVALGWLVPLGVLAPAATWLVVLGALLLSAGCVLGITGVAAFRRAGTNVNPHQPALRVVETGPYRLSRNPMYLGMVLIVAGLGLVASLDWALILAPMLWAVLHVGVVLREEAYLAAKFGDPYRAYLARTRRWL